MLKIQSRAVRYVNHQRKCEDICYQLMFYSIYSKRISTCVYLVLEIPLYTERGLYHVMEGGDCYCDLGEFHFLNIIHFYHDLYNGS